MNPLCFLTLTTWEHNLTFVGWLGWNSGFSLWSENKTSLQLNRPAQGPSNHPKKENQVWLMKSLVISCLAVLAAPWAFSSLWVPGKLRSGWLRVAPKRHGSRRAGYGLIITTQRDVPAIGPPSVPHAESLV